MAHFRAAISVKPSRISSMTACGAGLTNWQT